MTLFTPLDDGNRTRVETRLKMVKPKPVFIARFMVKREFGKMNPYEMWFSKIDELLEKENKLNA